MDIFSNYLINRDYVWIFMDIPDYLRNIDILYIYWIFISYL